MTAPEALANPVQLLDACAVVNLYATRWLGPILAANNGRFAIAGVVAREAQFVLRGGDGDDATERERIDLRPHLLTNALTVIESDDEQELLTFIDLSLEIDEGEAMTGALAIHRGCVVVTDDRKASRILSERGVSIRSSLDLIAVWGTQSVVTKAVLREALIALRQRGRYEPARRHPRRAWWDAIIEAP